jgi:predicted Fe-Mo cluster-binding NifX family protein
MKIAIATFGTRVSPRFDCAPSLLVVTVDATGTPVRQELSAVNWAPHQRIMGLLELGVDTVVCGGIDCWSAASLQSAGVTIYGWVAGEVEDALAALLRGELDSQAAMPSGAPCRCRRFPGYDAASAPPAAAERKASGRGGHAGRRGLAWGGPDAPANR